jgi:hypothetical protein
MEVLNSKNTRRQTADRPRAATRWKDLSRSDQIDYSDAIFKTEQVIHGRESVNSIMDPIARCRRRAWPFSFLLEPRGEEA